MHISIYVKLFTYSKLLICSPLKQLGQKLVRHIHGKNLIKKNNEGTVRVPFTVNPLYSNQQFYSIKEVNCIEVLLYMLSAMKRHQSSALAASFCWIGRKRFLYHIQWVNIELSLK